MHRGIRMRSPLPIVPRWEHPPTVYLSTPTTQSMRRVGIMVALLFGPMQVPTRPRLLLLAYRIQWAFSWPAMMKSYSTVPVQATESRGGHSTRLDFLRQCLPYFHVRVSSSASTIISTALRPTSIKWSENRWVARPIRWRLWLEPVFPDLLLTCSTVHMESLWPAA